MGTEVRLEHDGPIARITFHSPNGINMLSTASMAALEAHLNEVEQHSEIRIVIFSGEGRTFVAGADIAELSAAPGDAGRTLSRRGQQCMNKIANFEHAVTIAVDGPRGEVRGVIIGRQCLHGGEGADAQRRDPGLGPAGKHHVGLAALDEPHGRADRVGAQTGVT